MKKAARDRRWTAVALSGALVLSGCDKGRANAAVGESLDRQVDHATNLVLAACKPDREVTSALRATTTTTAYALSFRDLAACASDAGCKAPATSADATASLRELSDEARRFLDDGVSATSKALASASGERRARLHTALEKSAESMQAGQALAKLCGNPGKVSEVPEAMTKVNDKRAESRAATKSLRDGG